MRFGASVVNSLISVDLVLMLALSNFDLFRILNKIIWLKSYFLKGKYFVNPVTLSKNKLLAGSIYKGIHKYYS